MCRRSISSSVFISFARSRALWDSRNWASRTYSTTDADVEDAVATVAGAEHDYRCDLADLRESEANDAKAQTDLRRYKQLLDKHEVAESDYDQYDATAKSRTAAMAAKRAKANSSKEMIGQRQA